MLIDKQHVVLETGVEMRLKAKVHDDWVVVAIDMGVHSVQTLEELADETREGLGERNTCDYRVGLKRGL